MHWEPVVEIHLLQHAIIVNGIQFVTVRIGELYSATFHVNKEFGPCQLRNESRGHGQRIRDNAEARVLLYKNNRKNNRSVVKSVTSVIGRCTHTILVLQCNILQNKP